MGIECSGKNCKLWIKEREGRDGKWFSYSVGVSSKNAGGGWTNAYQDVRFTRNVSLPSDIQNGTLFDFEGWLGAKESKDRDGRQSNRVILFINKASFQMKERLPDDSFEAIEEDIPF